MARPKKDIDENQVRDLASINCSYEEMALIVGCDEKTLSNRFSQVIKEGRANLKMSLKRMQYELAKKGNATMLIWLGKIILGQRDDSDVGIQAYKAFVMNRIGPDNKPTGEQTVLKIEPEVKPEISQ